MDSPARPSQTYIVALALDNALNSSGDNAAVSHIQNSMIPIGESLPALPRNLLQKIWANDYIDFTELPPAKGSPTSMPHFMEGRVLLVQWQELENHKKAIPDFATWAQCYAAYTAAILQHQPHRAADLMAYLVETANNAKRYRWPSWLVYDQNFRQPSGRKDEVWAKTDLGIFTKCFTDQRKSGEAWCKECRSIKHSSADCPMASHLPITRQEQYRTPGPECKRAATICKIFNTKGSRFASNCYRHHVCPECHGNHPKTKCPNMANSSSQ